jgi:fatty-acyl-CoA synthase
VNGQQSGDWNYADVWEAIAETIPDETAQVYGERRPTWRDLDARADGLALTLLEHGAQRHDKVAMYLRNAPEYMESFFAALKISCVPVNTNYRYGVEELSYLWANADAIAVVFHGEYTPLVERARALTPGVRLWVHVDDGSGACPDWAVPYELAAASSPLRVTAGWDRSGDDLIFIYTGGTTGMPKGVMWRQRDLYAHANGGTPVDPEEPDYDHVRARAGSLRPALLPASPLMHGTGMTMGIAALRIGGVNVLLTGRSFDAVECLDLLERERCFGVSIVGDAFARPLLAALRAEPDRWNLEHVRLVASAGVMWSQPVKEGLLEFLPNATLGDGFASSEAFGMGGSQSTKGAVATTATFTLGDRARVVADDGRDVQPGSGEVGMVAVGGPQPLGYYKDEEKTARTFRVIDGERYAIPGDYATIDADGTLRVLGRGSVCINTGGEKVYPEEVEESLKTHPAVRDAIVVGVPDERFGEAITAVVELAAPLDEPATLREHVKEHLAAFKAPRHVFVVDSTERAPNGKADYPGWRRRAEDMVQQ